MTTTASAAKAANLTVYTSDQERYAALMRDCSCLDLAYPEIGPGWMPLFEAAMRSMQVVASEARMALTIHQVKEKFGSMRIHYFAETNPKVPDALTQRALETLDHIVDLAEAKSEETCETCGKPGKPRKGGWIKVKCDDCASLQEACQYF